MFDLEAQNKVLKNFLAKHIHPYCAEIDEYDCPPFTSDIKEGKNDPIYNAHSYHTKVPPRSIIPYILHYTQPGDLLLDMFSGSGMTGVATQMCARPPADILEQFPELKARVGPRACILNDLSPAACHIAYNYNTPVDVAALKREFDRVKAAVKDEFDWLYGTEHYEPAAGIYDITNADVACRVKNIPKETEASFKLGQMVLDGRSQYGSQDWELLNKAEVEARLGYPVNELPREDKWGDLDVSKVKRWISIPAIIQYAIWSDVYRCEGFITVEEPTGKVSTRGKNTGKPIMNKKRVGRGCLTEIVLWDTAFDGDGEMKDVIQCLHCGQDWQKTDLHRLRSEPVVSCYEHQNHQGQHPRFQRRITALEKHRLKEIEGRGIPFWYPTHRLDKRSEMYIRCALHLRNIETVADFYTKRNLYALASLWHQVNNVTPPELRSAMLFAFSGVAVTSSRMNTHHPGGQARPRIGTLYLPSLMEEANVIRLLNGKSKSQPKLFAYLQSAFGSGETQVLIGSATSLPIESTSIDYIFTDPPFGSNIFYSDLNIIWEAWMGQLTDPAQEAVWNKSRKPEDGGKTLADYTELMRQAFCEMHRVLKPGRWCTVEFNNSDGSVFEAIKSAAIDAGFELVNMLLLDKEQKSFKQVIGSRGEANVVDKDVLFNLHKPAMARVEVRSEEHDLEQHLVEAVRQHLQTLPERIKADPTRYNNEHRTTATINSMLMNTLIPRGVSVDRLNMPFIQRVCARYFRKVGQYWYLRGEAVAGNGSSLMQEEVAIKDELTAIAWLRQNLESRPMLIGELKPVWMKATGLLPALLSQILVLEDLLISNFWRDETTNRWREPTPTERDRMNDDKTIRVLHDAERYVASSLRRQTTDTERCEWIDTLFQMCRALEENDANVLPSIRDLSPDEGYRLIGRLFQGVLKERVSPAVYSRAAKQAEVASQRIVKEVEDKAGKAKAKRRKEEGPTLFDP